MARYDIPSLRKKHSMTQRQLAEALGLSQGFMSSVESGKNPFPDERIDDLQKVFPDENLEEYIISAPQRPSTNIGSFNEDSDVSINDPATFNTLMTFLNKQSKEIHNIEQSNGGEVKSYQDRLLSLSDELDKVRKEKYELLDENLRLKDLLRRNNIDFSNIEIKK